MSLSSLSRALARSSRSRQGSLFGGNGRLRAPPPPGGGSGGLGFVRGYLTSALGRRAAAANGAGKVGHWRCLVASSQFRRLFSDQSNKNYEKYFPKEKMDKPKGAGSDKSDSKKESNSDAQWNFQENSVKLFQDILAP